MITTRPWDDFHRHLRDGEMMQNLMKHLLPVQRMTVMPNLTPPLVTWEDAQDYHLRLKLALKHSGLPQEIASYVMFLMSIYLTPETTPDHVQLAARNGVRLVKAYPKDATTASGSGLRHEDYFKMNAVYRQMARFGMLLLLHGENTIPQDHRHREEAFLPTLKFIAERHPDLKIVLEHVSTAAAIEMVKELPNVAATITAHHLVLTYDDVFAPDGTFYPHHKCMPIAKRPEDREAVLAAATSGNPKFFLGSDCAAHPVEKKEVADPAAAASGVFTGPVLASVVIEVFEQAGKLDMLNDFVSGFGADWYGLPRNQGYTTFVKQPWVVADQYDGVVPFCAGRTLNWQLHEAVF